ncbi:endo-1,4-beta-xylanase [Paenibacillus sp. HGF5]|uniref:endo-1,4-beta-xylanase n=1 Tax=Paenibacillus sp. HGF5 TaxID=908341 RepID=UPI0011118DEE|nr:endo-1,4-beta-xylanase [Paenibacillus sp. HGF5]
MSKRTLIRRISLMLIAFMLFIPPGWSAAAVEPAQPPADQDIVIHQHFDGGTEGWFKRGTETVTSATYAYEGTGSLLTEGRTANWNGPGFNLSATNRLDKGATYEISAYVHLKEGTQGSQKLQLAMQQSGAEPEYVNFSSPVDVTADGWVEVKGRYKYDANASALQVYLQSPSSLDAAYYMDEFKVRLIEPAPDPGNGIPGGENTVVWDFEDGTTMDWGPRDSETVEALPEAAHSGGYGLKVRDRTNSWNGPSQDVKDIMASQKTYTISAYARLEQAPAAAVKLSLSMENKAAGAAETSYTTLASASASGTEWVELKGTFGFSSDMETLKLYVETSDLSNFYVDDIKLALPGSIQNDIPALKDVYREYFEIGAAVEPKHLSGVHKELLDYHYNSLVAENVMKPESLNPREGTYNFANADLIRDYARDHGMNLRVHTLLWHQQGAEWMLKDDKGQYLEATPENKTLVLQRLEAYIHEVAGRYKGDARDWDVVNEVIDEGRPDGMRDSQWYRITGLDYIRTAFHAARDAAGPEAKLYINDYSTHNPKKRDYLLNLVKQLKAEGVPIDGVGHQTHINISGPSIQQISDSIRMFGEAGFDNQLTELDVSVYTNNTDAFQTVPQELLDKQGYRYKELFEELKRLDQMGVDAGVEGGWISNVTLWGIADDHTWLHDRPAGTGRQDAPFPFDKQYQAKPAYWGMVDPSRLTIVRKTGTAVEGKAVIDGQPDVAWNLVPALKTEKLGALSAEFKTLWDKDHIYVSVDVKDGSIAPGDQVDIFAVVNGTLQEARIQRGAANTAETAGGYAGEALLQLHGTGALGGDIYFDVRVTDSGSDDGSEHGKNGAVVSWSDPRHAQESDQDGLGILTLAAAPKSAQAFYGTPKVDGELDGIWKGAAELATDVWVEGNSGATATFRTLWDENHLYVYAMVSDSLLSDASPNVWEQDSVEIFVDQNNGKTDAYQEDDGQYRMSFNNLRSFGGYAGEDNFTSAAKVIDGGYVVEAAIRLDKIKPEKGTVIGFDLQVNNDEDGQGTRDSVAIWSDPSGQSYQNTSRFGVLEFTKSSAPGGGDGNGGEHNGGGDGGSGANAGGGGSSTSPAPNTPSLEIRNNDGRILAVLSSQVLQQALDRAAAGVEGPKRAIVDIPAQTEAQSYEIQLPGKWLLGNSEVVLILQTEFGALELPSAWVRGAGVKDTETVTLRLAKASGSNWAAALREEIGDRPVFRVEVLAGDRALSWKSGKARLIWSVPYTPTKEELAQPDHIFVREIDANGQGGPLADSRYDAKQGIVRAALPHGGTFAVASAFKTFHDLKHVPWAIDAIETMASRGFIQGVSETLFDPQNEITRADFLVMLVRVLELEGPSEGRAAFGDVTSSAYYYKHVQIAAELGLVQGVGGNRFSPDTPMTRQDMMLVTQRALEAAGKKLEGEGALDAFADGDEVAEYAKSSAAVLAGSGIVNGMNGKISPKAYFTRAQAAVILERIWNWERIKTVNR